MTIWEMAEQEVWERIEEAGWPTEEISDTATVERMLDLFDHLTPVAIAKGKFTKGQLENALVWL